MPVRLEIFDVAGQRVRTLIDGKQSAAGPLRAFWDGTNEGGMRAASGVYFYRLTAGAFTATRKIVMLQ